MKQKKFSKAFRQMMTANGERAAFRDVQAVAPHLLNLGESVPIDPRNLWAFVVSLTTKRQTRAVRSLVVDMKYLLDTSNLSNHGK